MPVLPVWSSLFLVQVAGSERRDRAVAGLNCLVPANAAGWCVERKKQIVTRKNDMLQTDIPEGVFCEGQEVVLARGSNVGTHGVFLRYREDAHWADITQSNGAVRSHPVKWLALVETAGRP